MSVLRDKEFRSRLISLSLPIAFQNLMLALVAVADALMLGNIEQNAMAAVTLATQIQFLQNMIIGSVIGAASILGAQYWGKKDESSFLEIFNIAFRITAIMCICVFLACELCPATLMGLFTNDSVLLEIGVKYLRIAGFSYLIVGTSQVFLALLKVSEHTKVAAITSCMTVLINILLNGVFIYGLFGLPRMEAEGAALSTVIARSIELIACIAVSMRPGFVRPNWKRIFKQNAILFGDYLKCMWPLLGACLVWSVGFTSYTAFMGHLGQDAAAANSIVSVVRDCVCCVCDGLAVGGGILVGTVLGAGLLKKAKEYGDCIVILSYIVGVLSTLVMLVLTPGVLTFVKLTDQARRYLWGMMLVMAVYMIGRAVNSITINGIFAAGGDTIFDMYSLAVTMWGIAVPLAVLGTFVFHWHPVLVYACTCLDEVGKIPWVMVHYRKYLWVKDLTRDNV